MILKHKDMKDVAAKIVDWPRGFSRNEPCFAAVWWVNLRGMRLTGKPFICSPKPETILIKDFREWRELDEQTVRF